MLQSTNQEAAGSKARVADVLKSSLERGLVEEQDAVMIAGHGSHIVTNIVDPDVTGGQFDSSWDDAKFQAFTQRLSQLGEGQPAL